MASKSPKWIRRRAIEDQMAHLVMADTCLDIVIANARTIGHPRILAEAYGLRRELGALKSWLSQEWLEE